MLVAFANCQTQVCFPVSESSVAQMKYVVSRVANFVRQKQWDVACLKARVA
jgi:hypothetical protein